MCGIAGYANLNQNFKNQEILHRNTIHKMVDTIKHRGPDGQGIFLGKHVVFGHTNLKIIDLSPKPLPLTRMFRGYKFTITYNGEIYNMKSVRAELINLGYDFVSNSDAEVVLIA